MLDAQRADELSVARGRRADDVRAFPEGKLDDEDPDAVGEPGIFWAISLKRGD